jgi:murein DD-endopeptidase MepM/ murein hydrolase activator NlpD
VVEPVAVELDAEPFELAEPPASAPHEPVEPLAESEPEPAASGIDEFEAAARLFSFTGETPVQPPASDEEPAEPAAQTRSRDHVAPRRSKAERGASFRKVATASFSLGVVGIVGLMTVGMTTPAEAVAAASGADASMSVIAPADRSATDIDEDEIQAYVAPSTVLSDTLERTENYGTITMAELASEAGIQNFSNLFHNDPNSNIQWPFAVGVTMSYGYGMRSGRLHEGIDFTPGAGSPIQAIADGTVRVASEAGGAFGVHVIIDHMVDGELVSSHYAHMQYGSLQVEPGQRVTVGTVLGRTGNTGRSFGAHTHFEILQNGTTAIDPMPWLRTYTDGTHTVG